MNKFKDKKWKEFIIKDFLVVENSKVYHKNNLRDNKKGIAYITRTNLDNGLEATVLNRDYKVNPKNTIVFGAENATFFFQPFSYITGNKMYIVNGEKINKYTGIFLQKMFNESIKNCGFGYGKGLTGTRMKNRSVLLPINENGKPDWQFMEDYMKAHEQKLIARYKKYLAENKELLERRGGHSVFGWKEFPLEDIFEIKPGKRLTKADMKFGLKPFIGSTDNNNGITAFVSNENESFDQNVLGVNYNGSVGEAFYHPYQTLFSDDVKIFSIKNILGNRFVYLFLKMVILKQKEKYQYGYKFNEFRMRRQKVVLPVNEDEQPDYEYMENYMRSIEIRQLEKYLEYAA